MARSVRKGPYVEYHLLEKIQKAKSAGSKKVIKTWSRASTIIPDAVGLTFAVHNGRKFIPVYITESMVGHRFGEFSPTRVFGAHAKEKKAESSGGKAPKAGGK